MDTGVLAPPTQKDQPCWTITIHSHSSFPPLSTPPAQGTFLLFPLVRGTVGHRESARGRALTARDE